MRVPAAVIALSVILPINALDTGKTYVVNQCDDPIHLWSVGGTVGPETVLNQNSTYIEPYHVDPISNSVSIKVSLTSDGISQPNISQAIFSYNLAEDRIFYNLSQVYSDLHGRTYSVIPTDTTCESIYGGGSKEPFQSPTQNCTSSADITVTFCPRFCLSGGSKSFSLPAFRNTVSHSHV